MESELAYMGPVIAFDLDDTLFPELDYLKSGFRAVASYAAEELGLDKDLLMTQMMTTWERGENAFDFIKEKYFADNESFISNAVELYRFHRPEISLFPDAIPMLEHLADKGVRLALITDGRSKTQRNKLEALDILRFFAPENILISEETGNDKTALGSWQTIVRRYPNASRFIYVGDNPAKDFLMPNKLGWHTIGLKDRGENIHRQTTIHSPLHSPQIWIDSISEIEDIINRFLK